MSIQAITPAEAKAAKVALIPDGVILAVNRLLCERVSSSGYCTLTQPKVIEAILAEPSMQGITKAQLFDRGWLDFEPFFVKAGWSVTYDRPAYNECYEASWSFGPRQG